ncbi:MAG: ABC transporter permease [Cyanobacteria bacterium NC_groundwater_1444_Ag_S-0.65um_54_12]|nr:ABC transporter permease [Cyanobacteria bacterium NC_groundwater_1444_Ag_S-0.65um_54_12]
MPEFARNLVFSALAVLAALLLGAVVLWISGYDVLEALGALALGASGSINANAETLLTTTPLLLAALAVAIGLRGGLFNIGVEGQFLLGGLASVWVGSHLTFLPGPLLLPVILLAGMAGGAVWAAIAGILKARFGAHEVITTIMLNYIAMKGVAYLVRGPLHGPGPIPQTPYIMETAHLPILIPDTRLHAGLLLALLIALAVWWFLWKTPWGFAMRAVGLNPAAAEYAGVGMRRTLVGTMALSGALAGMAGGVQIAGVDFRLVQEGFSAGYGYDSIAVSLLGLNSPFGIILAAWLFAALRSGAAQMQVDAGVSSQIISVLQALVILLVAAEAGIRHTFDLAKQKRRTATATGAVCPPITQDRNSSAATPSPREQN